MYESPIHFCKQCRAYVALDQTREECAVRHQCVGPQCPLAQHLLPSSQSGVELIKEDARHPERRPPL